LAYLRFTQNPDAGFCSDRAFSAASDANSTAVAIQAIQATGSDPALGWSWARQASTDGISEIAVQRPLDNLLAYQLPGGAFEWQQDDGENILSTIQALPILAGATFPDGQGTMMIWMPLILMNTAG
jgi:hypothetical protein